MFSVALARSKRSRAGAPTRAGKSMPASCRPSPAGEHAAVGVATTVLIVAIASSAPAQQAPESPPTRWGVDCSSRFKMFDCRAVQKVLHRETGQLLVSEVWSADGKTGDMVLTLPVGLSLPESMLVKVDNSAPERLMKTCTNIGCFVTLTEKLVANMRTASDLKITVQDANKKPIEISLPLLGFGSAFNEALKR
jgi:invasion protein IalB